MTATKERRQQVLRRLVQTRNLRSQAEVCDALAGEGLATTQATVSRDLDELGAVKVRGPDGELVYRLAADPGPASARARLADTLARYVISSASSGNLAVLHTPPACASPVASAIDLAELPEVVATVAGDDTVLVVAADGVAGDRLAAHLEEMASQTVPRP